MNGLTHSIRAIFGRMLSIPMGEKPDECRTRERLDRLKIPATHPNPKKPLHNDEWPHSLDQRDIWPNALNSHSDSHESYT
jgi:hypothetical protein